MSQLLEGLNGVLCLMDDVLIVGKDQQEHDVRLIKVLERVVGRCYAKLRKV